MSVCTFIAIIWDPRSEMQVAHAGHLKTRLRQTRQHWRIVLDAPGVLVSVEPPTRFASYEVYPLAKDRGVVLGHVFERSRTSNGAFDATAPSPTFFDEDTSRQLIQSSGKFLKEKYWGRYLAFLSDDSSARYWVLRDPTGGIPCQSMKMGDVFVYFTRPVDVRELAKSQFRVNRHFICGMVAHCGSMFSGETGFEGVSTVLPGERVQHDGTHTKASYWNPIDIALDQLDVSPQEAKLSARNVVRECVHAWASRHQRILLQLSGGVDSTIIAACLATAPTQPSVTCLNFHSARETADERPFAREVATRHRFELLEVDAGPRDSIDLDAPQPLTVLPTALGAASPVWDGVWSSLAPRSIEVHLRGDGGDELFHRGLQLPDALDIAFRLGLNKDFWKAAWNDALIERTSIWDVLGSSLRYGSLKRPWDWRMTDELRTYRSFVTAEVREQAYRDESFLAPFFRDLRGCPPAKTGQAFSLQKFTNRFYVGERDRDRVNVLAPLISQPLMEFSLRTPLHILRHGARERGLIRCAFEDEIPRSIAWRNYKGLVSPTKLDWLTGNVDRVREMLLDGYLARERIVDRSLIESTLAKADLSSLCSHPMITSCVSVEAWVDRTLSSAAMAAA